MADRIERRAFLLHVGGLIALLGASATPAWGEGMRALRAGGAHPTPRPGITAAKVPTAKQLAATPDVVDVFDQVREIPAIVDGIRCSCGCAGQPGNYSLLSCFETMDAMAIHCEICQSQGRLVHRMHAAGRTLDEIRKGVDARFS